MKIIKAKTNLGSMGKNDGTELAPDLIVKKLKEIELNEDFKPLNFDTDEINIDINNLDITNKNIYEKIKGIKNGFLIGGDHSITYSSFKAFSEINKNCSLLMFDAHLDSDYYTKTATHEDFIRKLIDEEILKKENVIFVGVRKIYKSEFEFIINNKIKYFTMKNIFNNIEKNCDFIMEIVRNFDSLYLSIDIDVLDPSFAPGTCFLEPGGMSTRDLLYYLQRIKSLKNLKFIDLVEANPRGDINNITINACARIVAEMIN